MLEKNNDNKSKRAVYDAVLTVENHMHDAIWTTMNKMIIPRTAIALKSITGSSTIGPNIEGLYPHQRDFLGDAGNIPPMSASSRLDVNKNQDKNAETRKVEDYEGGEFPAIRSSHDQRALAHHMVTEHNDPHNSVPEYLTGRIQTQNGPLSKQLTQPQNVETHISPVNTLPVVGKTPQRYNSDSGSPINRLDEAIEGLASQQRPQTSSLLFKPPTTNTLIWDSENEKFELFGDISPTIIEMQPEMSEAMKIIQFHSHIRNDGLQTFEKMNASKNERSRTRSSFSEKSSSDVNHMPQQKINGINSHLTPARNDSQISFRSEMNVPNNLLYLLHSR